ncbi:MAG: alpha/beta hydrolase [Planctomyces sp.]|nr:alpha/beta hydrolase [Planctomyces sp.]
MSSATSLQRIRSAAVHSILLPGIMLIHPATFAQQPQTVSQEVTNAATAPADGTEQLQLWPDGHPEPRVPIDPPERRETAADGLTRRFNVSNPRLIIHRPQKVLPANDSRRTTAIIVAPGGGFGRLSDEHEGLDVCRWLTSRGVTAIQLVYRTPTSRHPTPFTGPVQDLQKALIEVRKNAEGLNIDPENVGVMGFSAGGQTALIAAYGDPLIPEQTSQKENDTQHEPFRPDFLMLIYPYQVLGHAEKQIAGDGATGETTTRLRPEVHPDQAHIPTFIAQSSDDQASAPEGSIQLYLELRKRGIPAELHLYESGGHGFGMRPRNAGNGAHDWSGRAEVWLRMHEWMPSSQETK